MDYYNIMKEGWKLSYIQRNDAIRVMVMLKNSGFEEDPRCNNLNIIDLLKNEEYDKYCIYSNKDSLVFEVVSMEYWNLEPDNGRYVECLKSDIKEALSFVNEEFEYED